MIQKQQEFIFNILEIEKSKTRSPADSVSDEDPLLPSELAVFSLSCQRKVFFYFTIEGLFYSRRSILQGHSPILWPPDTKSWLIGKWSWCWEGLRAGREGGYRGWDGWMASSIKWTSTWTDSGRWWGTGRPGVLQFMWPHRFRYDLATEQQHHFHSFQPSLIT